MPGEPPPDAPAPARDGAARPAARRWPPGLGEAPEPFLAVVSFVVPAMVAGLMVPIADIGIGLGFYRLLPDSAPAVLLLLGTFAGLSAWAGLAGVAAFRRSVVPRRRTAGLVGAVLGFTVAGFALLLLPLFLGFDGE